MIMNLLSLKGVRRRGAHPFRISYNFKKGTQPPESPSTITLLNTHKEEEIILMVARAEHE